MESMTGFPFLEIDHIQRYMRTSGIVLEDERL